MLRAAVEELCNAGHPFSADTLALAFNHLDAGGKFEQPEAEMVEISDDEDRRRRHIESLSANAEKMTDWELEKNLRAAGIYVTSCGTI